MLSFAVVSSWDFDARRDLEEMLRPFRDPTVGYVSAPSICDRNAAGSWSARSRLYAEGMLHDWRIDPVDLEPIRR